MPGRILVIRGGAIGDFILTLPAIGLLRENFPACHIEVLGYRRVLDLVLHRHYADATRSIEYGPLASFFNPKSDPDPALADYFLSFQQIISYIYDPDRLFESVLRRLGVKNYIAASPMINDSAHAAFQLAKPLEDLALFLADPAARLHPNETDHAAAAGIMPATSQPVVVHPGSGSTSKNWPLPSWRALISGLLDAKMPVVAVGGEADSDRLNDLRRAFGHQLAIIDSVPLATLAAAMTHARLFIGHDSGVSHLAAAVGTRCLLLFGPTDPAVWAPANTGVEVLAAPDGNLDKITADSVLAAVLPIVPTHGSTT